MQKKMSNQELQLLVEKVSLEFFNRSFEHRAIFNRRLKTTGGRYHLKDHHLDFNPQMYEEYGEAILIGIIKHELCHYHLHLQDLGYKHQDQDFKKLLRQVDGLRYAPKSKKQAQRQLIYQCQQCQVKIVRRNKFNTDRLVCGKCHGQFKLIVEKN